MLYANTPATFEKVLVAFIGRLKADFSKLPDKGVDYLEIYFDERNLRKLMKVLEKIGVKIMQVFNRCKKIVSNSVEEVK